METREIPIITQFEYEFFKRIPSRFKYMTLSLDRDEIKLWTREPHYVLCDWYELGAETIDISLLRKTCFWDLEDEECYSIEELMRAYEESEEK